MSKRIYLTTDSNGAQRLIKASSAPQAIAYHARSTIKAHVPHQEELIALTKAGVEVEEAVAATTDGAAE